MSESFLPSAPRMKGSRVLDIKDHTNPESVWNLVDSKFQYSINSIDQKTWELTREQIERKIPISQTLNRLRLTFWDKYNERIASGDRKPITHSEVIGKITSFENGRNIFEDKIMMAYILLPVDDYNSMVNEALELGLSKLRRCMAYLEPVDPNGVGFRKEQLNLLLKIVDFLDKRVHGTAVQRIESKSLQITGDIKREENLTPAQIAQKIKELEEDLNNQNNVVEIKK